VTGVQTCALPISPKPQNPYDSASKLNKLNNQNIAESNCSIFL
jgi:hypothetical protein